MLNHWSPLKSSLLLVRDSKQAQDLLGTIEITIGAHWSWILWMRIKIIWSRRCLTLGAHRSLKFQMISGFSGHSRNYNCSLLELIGVVDLWWRYRFLYTATFPLTVKKVILNLSFLTIGVSEDDGVGGLRTEKFIFKDCR